MKNQDSFLFLFFMVIIVGLQSCGPTYRLRRQDKQDQKLYKEVISNDRVLPKAANVWNLLNPIDAKIVYIKGDETIKIDSIPYDRVHDSLIQAECPTINFDSLRKAYIKTVYIYRVDTLSRPDTTKERLIARLKDSVINLKVLNASKDGQIFQSDKQTKEEKKDAGKWLWLFIVACIIIVAENGLLLYNFLRPKVKV